MGGGDQKDGNAAAIPVEDAFSWMFRPPVTREQTDAWFQPPAAQPSELPTPPGGQDENYAGKSLKYLANDVRQGILPDEALEEIKRNPTGLRAMMAYGEAAMAAGTLLSGGEGGKLPKGEVPTVYHGTQGGGELTPGRSGLIYASTDRGYAEQFMDPMRLGKEPGRLHEFKAKMENPKEFRMENDAEYNAFTQYGFTADDLLRAGHDGAILTNKGKIVDVAMTHPDQARYATPTTIKLTGDDASELSHKLSVLADTPELHESYGLNRDQVVALLDSVPSGGEWEIPPWANKAVHGELQDHVGNLRNTADNARSDGDRAEASRLNKQATRFERMLDELIGGRKSQ